MARLQGLAGSDLVLINAEIAVAVDRFHFAVLDLNGRINDMAAGGDGFVDFALPDEMPLIFDQPLPPVKYFIITMSVSGLRAALSASSCFCWSGRITSSASSHIQ